MISFSLIVTCLVATVPVLGNPMGKSNVELNGDIVNFDRAVVGRNTGKTPRSLLSDDTLARCDKAHNCEIYDDPKFGKSIRFVAGMEPGSVDYNATVLAPEEQRAKAIDNTTSALQRRDWNDHSNMEAGHNVFNWGNIQPQVVMNNLYNPCQWSTCDTTPQYYPTSAVRWSGPNSRPAYYSIIFSAEGQYDGYDRRNNFIEAIKVMSEKGQSWTNEHWYSHVVLSNREFYDESGDLWEIRQSDFFNINHWGPNEVFKGYMRVHIWSDWGDKANWGCGRVNDFVKDAISAIVPWGGAFFGLMRPDCK